MSNWLDLKLEGTKPVCEVGALKFCIEELERENAELKAQLVGVNNNRTGISPCAKFCEALAAKKMFDNLQRENTSLLSLLADIRHELVQYIAELHAKSGERDTLKAQVERFREVINHYQEGQVPSDNAMDELIHRANKTPTQCLAEVKAQVAFDAITSALRLYGEPSMSAAEIGELADGYANQLRQQAKGGE